MGRLKRGTPLLSRDWLRAIDSTRALKRSKISAMTRRSWARVGVCFVVWPNGQVGLSTAERSAMRGIGRSQRGRSKRSEDDWPRTAMLPKSTWKSPERCPVCRRLGSQGAQIRGLDQKQVCFCERHRNGVGVRWWWTAGWGSHGSEKRLPGRSLAGLGLTVLYRDARPRIRIS
jgi:hypothetical protein